MTAFWQRVRNWCLLGVPDLQILLKVIFIRKSLGVIPHFAYFFGSTQRGGHNTVKGWWESLTTWHSRVYSETNEACQTLWKGCCCFYCCMAELAFGSNSYFFHWLDVAFCDKATPRLSIFWQPGNGWARKKKRLSHRILIKKKKPKQPTTNPTKTIGYLRKCFIHKQCYCNLKSNIIFETSLKDGGSIDVWHYLCIGNIVHVFSFVQLFYVFSVF